jgi:hypothetical protein
MCSTCICVVHALLLLQDIFEHHMINLHVHYNSSNIFLTDGRKGDTSLIGLFYLEDMRNVHLDLQEICFTYIL